MGNFYVNITAKGPKQQDLANYLRGKNSSAFLSPTIAGVTTIYEAGCDRQEFKYISALTADLSRELTCPALAVVNHDDDWFGYEFYRDGLLDHEYDAWPGYFDPDVGPAPPAGGNAASLCQAFGGDVGEVERVLRRGHEDEGRYVFQIERHDALVKALGLPDLSVGYGYKYLSRGDFPPGHKETDFVRI